MACSIEHFTVYSPHDATTCWVAAARDVCLRLSSSAASNVVCCAQPLSLQCCGTFIPAWWNFHPCLVELSSLLWTFNPCYVELIPAVELGGSNENLIPPYSVALNYSVQWARDLSPVLHLHMSTIMSCQARRSPTPTPHGKRWYITRCLQSGT